MSTGHHIRRIRTVAEFARFCVQHLPEFDRALAHSMLRDGIRKLHDKAESDIGKGKYLGHVHWSKAAKRLIKSNPDLLTSRPGSFGLLHEHVVPVQVMVEALMKLRKNAPVQRYEEILQRLSLVAIITAQEANLFTGRLRNNMPEGWDGKDLWARYREVGLIRNIPTAA